MIDVVWLSYKKDVPASDYWDHGTLHQLFDDKLWSPVGGYEFKHSKSLKNVTEGAVIVLPAREQTDMVKAINNDIKRLKWVVMIITGDEDNSFPYEDIKHPNIKFWIMSPNPARHGDDCRKIGSGVPPQGYDLIPKYEAEYQDKKLDFFFAGQITHERRQQMADSILTIREFKVHNKLEGDWHFSKGFTQGVEHAEYYKKLASAKAAPCPSGPETPESFRLFEALEAGCVPLADTRTPKGGYPDDYWTYFFGEQPPFPVITEYDQLQGYIDDTKNRWPTLQNRVFAWWQGKKREMAYWLAEDIKDKGGVQIEPTIRDLITVIIPSSPIPSHPSTEIIEQTIADIRAQLPRCEIIITLDGIRSEQEDRRADYEQYISRLLWKCNNEWDNVLPIIFDEHMHQAAMCREALKLVKTPIIMYVEHDTPIVPDKAYDWRQLCDTILKGDANIIRFNHESFILPDHEHMMLDKPFAQDINGTRLIRTKQWSQRPHLAMTSFYAHMLETYFTPGARTMIEDRMHGIVEIDCRENGDMGWYNWRIWIYAPNDDDMKYSYNLDGRKDDPKFSETYIF